MKKFLLVLILSFILFPQAYAEEVDTKIEVELVKCDSISNIWVNVSNEAKRIHLLALEVDSGPLDNKINEYVCTTLESATKIEIEYDIETTDKYNRELVYLYYDDNLLQEKLLNIGYGQVNNVQDNYKFLQEFCDIQKQAITKSLGIWNYSNIEEKYCKSGVEIGSYYEEEKKDESKKTFNLKILKFMIFINSGILLLILISKMKNATIN